jgi:hypothetical protein
MFSLFVRFATNPVGRLIEERTVWLAIRFIMNFHIRALPQIEWVDYRMRDERQRAIRPDIGYRESLEGIQC